MTDTERKVLKIGVEGDILSRESSLKVREGLKKAIMVIRNINFPLPILPPESGPSILTNDLL